MAGRRPAVIAGILALVIAGQAGALEISGAFGNAEGCRMHRGEQPSGDDVQLVTADEITNYGTGCEIVQMLPSKGGISAVAVGLCGYEGEAYLGVQHFVVRRSDSAPSSLIVYNEDGSIWGEVAPCP